MAHDVFISHSSKDKVMADAICAGLEARGIRCWIAPRDVQPGMEWTKSIVDAISTCKLFLLVLTDNSNRSVQAVKEVDCALNHERIVLPFRIEDVKPTGSMEYYLSSIHWLDALTPPLEKHIDNLAKYIGRIIETPVIKSEEKPALLVSPESLVPTTEAKKKLTWLWLTITGAVLVVVALVLMLTNGWYKASTLSKNTGTPPPSIPSAFSPSADVHPTTTTAPPSIPAWMVEVNAWANPILMAIESQPPDFEDDFYETDSAWKVSFNETHCPAFDPAGKFIIINGELQLKLNPSCTHFGFTHPDIEEPVGSYVLQIDIDFAQTTNSFEIGSMTDQGSAFAFILNPENWVMTIPDSETQDWLIIQEGSYPVDFSKPVTFTVIKNEVTILFYLDEILLLSYGIPKNGEATQTIGLLVSNRNVRSNVESTTLDNVRFWDLDNLFIPERILSQIEKEPPAFTDDFHSVDPAWELWSNKTDTYVPENADFEITDGLMRLFLKNVKKDQGGVLKHPDLIYSDYVLQMDVRFLDDQAGIEFRTWDPLVPEYYFWLSGSGEWTYIERKGEQIITRRDGQIPLGEKPDFSKPFMITIINNSPYYVVYLNSSLLFSYSQQLGRSHSELDFQLLPVSTLKKTLTVELDKVEIWDVTGQQ